MKLFNFLIFFCLAIFIISCNEKSVKQNNQVASKLKFAKGFDVEDKGAYKILTVKNPWQGAHNISYTYLLKKAVAKIPVEIQNIETITIPVKKVICLSTTHIALIDFFDKTQSIVGVSGSDLISNIQVVEQIKSKKTVDVGYDQNLNYEKILSLAPDVIFVYGVGGETAGFINKLRELKQKVVVVAEYLEGSPLATAEWVKFMAAFYDTDEIANAKFDSLSVAYEQMKKKVASIKNLHRPRVLTNMPYKDKWYISGGKSNLAIMIKDAGGEYLWENNPSRESLVLNIEEIYMKAQQADVWLNTGTAISQIEILNCDQRLKFFAPFKNNRIYNNNARCTTSGGNDFYESGVTHPDEILKDIVSIFHSEILLNRKMVYYKKLN